MLPIATRDAAHREAVATAQARVNAAVTTRDAAQRASFDAALARADSIVGLGFNPDQERAPDGKFGPGGSTGGEAGAGTGWQDLRGAAREKAADAVWSMYEKSYAAIGMHLAGKADMMEYDHWSVMGTPPHAFVVSKTTPYGQKLGLLGTDGSKDGKTAVKDWLRTSFHKAGVYGEVSHGVEHLAAGSPVVAAAHVGAILGKTVEPSADGLHYGRNLAGVGRVEKLMVGRPKGVPTQDGGSDGHHEAR